MKISSEFTVYISGESTFLVFYLMSVCYIMLGKVSLPIYMMIIVKFWQDIWYG